MCPAATEEARQDRRSAFERVVDAYESPLLRYAGRLLLDHDAAQDVVQETFLRLLRGWCDALEPSPAIQAWLYRVAHNCAVDHIRGKQRRADLHRRHADERPARPPPSPGDSPGLSEDAELAARALRTLSLREQQLVVLKVFEERSYREIADIAELTVSNVGYILHHAMKKLAAALRAMKGEADAHA